MSKKVTKKRVMISLRPEELEIVKRFAKPFRLPLATTIVGMIRMCEGLQLTKCPNCGEDLVIDISAKHCPQCGAPLKAGIKEK